MSIVTRFAPSPTGYLHIGSARTALFNYLFAKHYNGKFLLRIEDTDKARSTKEATDAIFSGLKWLGIDHDDEAIVQSARIDRHKQIAYDLLKKGAAYKCFMTQDEISHLRNNAMEEGASFLLNSKWRDVSEEDHPKDLSYVIRIKAPRNGQVTINDMVQGNVSVQSKNLDDMIILRSDGTPTYMLAVCVDDYDMQVTHIIRGDDHLNNAFRQKLIYEAMGWTYPVTAHIPLIHGPDGAKLSKRHGAVGVDAYKEMGYLPEALFSYLLRLGWSHGDDEIIRKNEAIKWFDGSHIGKAPSRLDFAKMLHINSVFLREKSDDDLISIIVNEWSKENIEINESTLSNLKNSISEIKVRSSTVNELANLAKIYHTDKIFDLQDDAYQFLKQTDKNFAQELLTLTQNTIFDNVNDIQESFRLFAINKSIKLSEVMKLVRVILTGKTFSPSVFEIMHIIGKDACVKRFDIISEILD
ncbi:MAG: glutamate--tRNA ligase [Rickettsiaceae bacterium]|nr:glutamate--tRNA ligase [Rickettsiaceae bacterium]